MSAFGLMAMGSGVLYLIAKVKKGKAAYDLGIQLENVRVVKWQAGYATLGVSFRLTNKNSTSITLDNYSIGVTYMNTEIANNSDTLQDATIPANGQSVVEFQINTANYTAGLFSLLQDLFLKADHEKIKIDYCIKAKSLPKFCDTEEYEL